MATKKKPVAKKTPQKQATKFKKGDVVINSKDMRERTVDGYDGKDDVYLTQKMGKLNLGRWVKESDISLAPKTAKKDEGK